MRTLNCAGSFVIFVTLFSLASRGAAAGPLLFLRRAIAHDAGGVSG
jgi:hypothetical protein